MNSAAQRRDQVLARIRSAEQAAGREPGQTEVLAVSKRHPASAIRASYALGQRKFGENYVSEALAKKVEMSELDIEWHYIGPIQSNKTREIAAHFDWVHSIDREKVLRRLSQQRPESLNALDCCIQVKVGNESSKSGAGVGQVEALVKLARDLPRIKLRGLMVIPPPSNDPDQQSAWFAQVRELYQQLKHDGYELDTLSMGMSQDLEAAISQGATLVRIGTALFGPRNN